MLLVIKDRAISSGNSPNFAFDMIVKPTVTNVLYASIRRLAAVLAAFISSSLVSAAILSSHLPALIVHLKSLTHLANPPGIRSASGLYSTL